MEEHRYFTSFLQNHWRNIKIIVPQSIGSLWWVSAINQKRKKYLAVINSTGSDRQSHPKAGKQRNLTLQYRQKGKIFQGDFSRQKLSITAKLEAVGLRAAGSGHSAKDNVARGRLSSFYFSVHLSSLVHARSSSSIFFLFYSFVYLFNTFVQLRS